MRASPSLSPERVFCVVLYNGIVFMQELVLSVGLKVFLALDDLRVLNPTFLNILLLDKQLIRLGVLVIKEGIR